MNHDIASGWNNFMPMHIQYHLSAMWLNCWLMLTNFVKNKSHKGLVLPPEIFTDRETGSYFNVKYAFLSVNSSPPSVVFMCQWTGSKLVQIMACHLFGTKRLPEAMPLSCLNQAIIWNNTDYWPSSLRHICVTRKNLACYTVHDCWLQDSQMDFWLMITFIWFLSLNIEWG